MMARVRSRYIPNEASMAAFLMSDRVGDVSMQAGRDIVDDARALAIAEGRVDTATYVENFHVDESVGGHKAEGGPRRAANVVNDDEAAAANEFGNDHTQGGRILTRAGARYHTPRALRNARRR